MQTILMFTLSSSYFSAYLMLIFDKIFMMKNTFLVLFLLLVNLGCAQNNSKHITKVSQNDIKEGILVDVRTPEEFEMGHLENALNINWFDADFVQRFNEIDKDKTIYVYCKKGGRSAKAQDKLRSMGFKNVIDLEGGYDAWLESKK